MKGFSPGKYKKLGRKETTEKVFDKKGLEYYNKIRKMKEGEQKVNFGPPKLTFSEIRKANFSMRKNRKSLQNRIDFLGNVFHKFLYERKTQVLPSKMDFLGSLLCKFLHEKKCLFCRTRLFFVNGRIPSAERSFELRPFAGGSGPGTVSERREPDAGNTDVGSISS